MIKGIILNRALGVVSPALRGSVRLRTDRLVTTASLLAGVRTESLSFNRSACYGSG